MQVTEKKSQVRHDWHWATTELSPARNIYSTKLYPSPTTLPILLDHPTFSCFQNPPPPGVPAHEPAPFSTLLGVGGRQ